MTESTIDFRAQWKSVDMDFFKEFISLHNQMSFGQKTQSDFNKFVIEHQEKFDNPDYLQIFAENITLFNEEFYRENLEMCKVFYNFMQNNPDWRKLPFGLRTSMRLGTFEDEFKKILNK